MMTARWLVSSILPYLEGGARLVAARFREAIEHPV
jgi:hypothetical protein